MVGAVVALVAWALQLMQAATDRREFSLMLAGCMVCSAAVGLATVMVLTLTSPDRVAARGLPAAVEAGVSLDAIVLPWDGEL
jgi:phosphatidylserine synthase